ncbi:MAG: ATP-binding cassette domain-containing protein [Zoogloeaceae bacterium]|jgi:lipooligosaccharide transport system ATP-binding protein|nr:ATP-binding cassette domain-containing protein [Zoogloeaceae bacterium]
MKTPPLFARALKKSYACAPVVDDLSFTLEKGGCFGLLGPNGAGKTTTLKLCLGLAVPDAGEITLAGHRVPEAAQTARASVGVVPQFDNLDPDFTVSENLRVFGRYFGLSKKEMTARMDDLLRFSSLEGKRDTRINALSGGMRRRLTLARALVNDPNILFLDEPTTGLDPQARHLIWERLKTLQNLGKTLLLTTHFMDEAERLCDWIMIIDGGRKIAEGSPRELIARHIEAQVIEVYDASGTPGALESFACAARAQSGMEGARMEKSGETLFFYVHAAAARRLLQLLAQWPMLRYAHRAANLEDVFIRLTGRELRD